MRKNVYIAKLIFHKGAKTIKDENFALLIESLKQATDYKNGNKDAARSLIRDTDDMGVGIDLSPTGDVGLETSIFFKTDVSGGIN